MNLWGDKPYHSLDWELKKRFGQKVYRLALNGGTTCPNRDGTVGTGGCIFCSEGGSGDFAGRAVLSVPRQMEEQKKLLSSKRPANLYIAYFQAYTATYAPVDYLRKIFTQAIEQPETAVLSVATRPDCLPEECLDLLAELNQIKPVWVELGLQTMHEDTARFIRRGSDLSVFEQAVSALRSRQLEVIVHTILGLPGECGENKKRVFETMEYLNRQDVQGIKLQLLHVLKNTDLARYYFQTKGMERSSSFPAFAPLEMDEYIDLVIECLEMLRPDMVIHRLTGDGPKDLLIAPEWSSRKRTVLNTLHHRMKECGAYQGRRYAGANGDGSLPARRESNG